MSDYTAIIMDLDRCVGCYACEIACRKENDLPESKSWIKVNEIGPEMVGDRLTMDFVVSITQNCTLCKKRLERGLEPFCVASCPTKALTYCSETTELLSNVKKSRIQILKLVKKSENN